MKKMLEMRVQSLGQEDPLEKAMTTDSSILAWRIPWTEEPGGPQSTGSQRVGHDWSNLACTNTHMCILAIVDSSVMNIGVRVSFWIMVSSRYMPRNVIAESYSTPIFSFLRSIHTVLYNGCTGLHFTGFGCSKQVSQFFLQTPTQAIRHMLKKRFDIRSQCCP